MMKDFRAYVGNEEQVYGVRRVILDEGNARGIAMYQVTTAGGLELDILPDSGLDIGRVKFRGININYTTKNGYDSPARSFLFTENLTAIFPAECYSRAVCSQQARRIQTQTEHFTLFTDAFTD